VRWLVSLLLIEEWPGREPCQGLDQLGDLGHAQLAGLFRRLARCSRFQVLIARMDRRRAAMPTVLSPTARPAPAASAPALFALAGHRLAGVAERQDDRAASAAGSNTPEM